MGFALPWLLLMRSMGSRHMASVVTACAPRSCSSQALEHKLRNCSSWTLLLHGVIGPMSLHWQEDSLPLGASLVAQMVKRLLAMCETQVWLVGRDDPLEKEMATHSRTLTRKIPWIEEPVRLQSMGSQRIGHNWATSLSFFTVEPPVKAFLLLVSLYQSIACP